MNRKSWLVGLFACFLVAGSGWSAPLTKVAGHTLSLDIQVDGKSIMTPMIEVLPDTPVKIEVSEPDGLGYTLQLFLKDQQRVGRFDDAVGIDVQLFRGAGNSKSALANPTLFMRPGGSGSATVSSSGGEVSVAVLSHAIRQHMMTPEQYASALKGCVSSGASSLASQDDVQQTSGRESCCSAACNPGSGGTLRCCGAISCCACGVCCYPP